MKFTNFVMICLGVLFAGFAFLVLFGGCGEEWQTEADELSECELVATFMFDTCGMRIHDGEYGYPVSSNDLAQYCESEDYEFWECVFECMDEEVYNLETRNDCTRFKSCIRSDGLDCWSLQ